MGASAECIGRLRTGEELVRLSFDLAQPAAELAGAVASDPKASEVWIHCLPAGPDVSARDGRRFRVEDLQAIASASELPMLVDWEHRSEGEDTVAAGWIEAWRVDKEGLWGRCRWTPKGRDHVVQQDYRFLSPVVMGRRGADKALTVLKLSSVALTNRPALKLRGIELLREQLSVRHGAFALENEEPTMDKLSKLVREACGLEADASEDDLITALKPRLKKGDDTSVREALSTMTSERNQLDTKVKALETELLSFKGEAFKREVEVFFADGSRAGKIQPAARDKWMSFALKSADNFATFKDIIYPDLPVVGAPQGGNKTGKPGKEKLRGKSPETGIDYDALRNIGLTAAEIRASERDIFRTMDTGPGDEDDDDDDDDKTDDADEGDTTDDENAPAPQQGA